MAQNKLKIVLCGHYGSTNIGDEAIGLSMVESLSKSYPDSEITVLSYDKKRSKEFYNKYLPQFNIQTAYLIPLGLRSFIRGVFKGELRHTLRQIKDCDRFVLGGGGLFNDERLFAVILWGIHAYFAYKYKKQVLMIGQSIGPLKTRLARWLVKRVFSRASLINLRDKKSKTILENLGIKNKIKVTTDPVFGLNFQTKNYENSYINHLNKKIEQCDLNGYFVFTIRPWDKNLEKLYTNFIQLIGKISQKYKLLPVFVPFQLIKENDNEVLNKIIVQKPIISNLEIKSYTENVDEILDLFTHARFTLGVRLHSLLFSLLAGTPFLGVSYSSKIENFLKTIGCEKYLIKLDDEKANLEKIDYILKNKEEITKKFKQINSGLKAEWEMNDFVM